MPDTQENLETAFAGESQANRKYLAYAKQAEKDGFPNVGKMFRAIAEAETIHAHAHLRAMGKIHSTLENLEDAKNGEHYEILQMYPPMIDQAKKEGHKQGERTTSFALEAEKGHEVLYEKAINAVKTKKDINNKDFYVCPVCGFTMEPEPPDNCPVCKAKKELFIKF
ncbi:MAG: rubrerythrin family protein [Candidatus Lokiarchaeota archaeon]|nr:rubrerythrin family protein [Candidatus Lokiarchaeota archaeon]